MNYEEAWLTENIVDLFPLEWQEDILRNIHYGRGMYEAAVLFGPSGALVGAGGVRQNEERQWVAWIWVGSEKPADRLALLRRAYRWLKNWQYRTGYSAYAIVYEHNPIGQKLARWMGFTEEGKYIHHQKPENNFGVWIRER